MVGQGRRLCNPGEGRGADPVCVGLLFECRRAADLRDRATARRPRIPLVLRRELLISAGPGEWRAAWVEDGAAVELYVERGDSSPPGSIFVGRVLRLLPGLAAALVDIGAALAPSLALPGGGSIHIAETRAAVLIDVDTGTPEVGSAERTALAANLAAAEAIARQLRLRQLGGGIVVDFAALDGRGRREKVRQVLAAALASDPAEPRVLGWTRLAHLELVRPRRGRPVR